jgi:ATP-dependent exoDNAse (exonuclease V) beta subunit
MNPMCLIFYQKRIIEQDIQNHTWLTLSLEPIWRKCNMKKVTHNNITCYFNEDNHTYVTSNHKYLKSATTYAKQFFNEFDKQTISKNYATKNNLNQEQVLQSWANKATKSVAIGNACHAYAEALLLNTQVDVIQSIKDQELRDICLPRFNVVAKKIGELLQDHILVGSEVIVFSERFGIAGTIDLLMAKGKTLCIYDWKTNEKIEKNNKYKKCLGPLWQFDDCNLIKYQTQLNLYKQLIELEGFYPMYDRIEMALFHIQPTCCVTIPIEPFHGSIKII